MKKYIKLAVVGVMASLYSCQKNDIEVLRNNDVSWKVDDVVTNADIRTRIGYDPRFDYIFTENTLIDIPMYYLGDFQITGKKEMQVKVQLAQPVDRNVTVSLKYDTNLFEKVRSSYGEYKLAKEDFVTLDATQKEITKGETSATFTISVNNDATLKDKLLLPYSLVAINDEKVKVVDTYENVLLKVFPEEVKLQFPSEINLGVVADSNSDIFSSKATIDLGLSTVIDTPEPITLSLEKDAQNPTNLPTGAEGVLPDGIDVRGTTSKEIEFNLDRTKLTQVGRTYHLPLRMVLKQGTKSYKQPVLLNLLLQTISAQTTAYLDTKKTGSKMQNKSEIKTSFTTRTSYLTEINDNNYSRSNYATALSPTQMTVQIPQKNVKSFVISSVPNQPLETASLYAVDSTGAEVFLGKITFPLTNDMVEFVIGFKSPVKASKFIFKDFKSTKLNVSIREIDIYE